ncbi:MULTISPECIES: hypothetical protein [Gemella]|uniref:hypothetical protein n=1 Tax=Gemella TaxID=1378 RepID=UPI0007680903|nr:MULTISPECIES: hypothetical protein [Gemella]AME08693.1 hypothetical protein AXE85_00045 [Gemella sp. oral taxon 928]AXI26270.1 hypothetical protein CG018_01805 [Gemella sp. ND 6198]
MKKPCYMIIITFLIIILSSGCSLSGSKHLTTEGIQKRLEERYNTGEVKVEQIDSKSWAVSLTKYPDVKYTVKEKVGFNPSIPVPEYKFVDNRIEKVCNLVAPKYFTVDEMKNITYSTGMVKIKWDVKDDKDIITLSSKIEKFCKDMRENYSQIVDDAVVNVLFYESSVIFPKTSKNKLAKWEDLDEKNISLYLDTTYGNGNYTYKKSNLVSHDGEIEVRLAAYPDIPFYLSIQKKNFGFKKVISDTRYYDTSVYVASTFPKSDYDNNAQFLNIEAVENIYGNELNGFYLKRYLEFEKEKDVISKISYIHKELRNYINQYPMLIYKDYPKNQEKVEPPMLTELSIRL